MHAAHTVNTCVMQHVHIYTVLCAQACVCALMNFGSSERTLNSTQSYAIRANGVLSGAVHKKYTPQNYCACRGHKEEVAPTQAYGAEAK